MKKLNLCFTQDNRPIVKFTIHQKATHPGQNCTKNQLDVLNKQNILKKKNKSKELFKSRKITIKNKDSNLLEPNLVKNKKIINSQKRKSDKKALVDNLLRHPLLQYLEKISKTQKVRRKAVRFYSQVPIVEKYYKVEDNIFDQDIEEEKWEDDVNQIFQSIHQLKQIGYSDKKINQWIGSYWQKRKKQLMCIFMQVGKKKVLSNEVTYEYEKNPEIIKAKIGKYLIDLTSKQRKFISRDIVEFNNYIEDILIEKNHQKLKEIQSSIQHQKLALKGLHYQQDEPLQKESAEVYHFIYDLKRLEDRYGQLKMVSRLNRVRFMQLAKSQDYLYV